MAAENLADAVNSLTADEQESVLAAVDEFIDLHPELLRRLAQ